MMDWPRCPRCKQEVLLPLSDYGPEGAAVAIKVWCCINTVCGFSLRIDKGIPAYGRRVESQNGR